MRKDEATGREDWWAARPLRSLPPRWVPVHLSSSAEGRPCSTSWETTAPWTPGGHPAAGPQRGDATTGDSAAPRASTQPPRAPSLPPCTLPLPPCLLHEELLPSATPRAKSAASKQAVGTNPGHCKHDRKQHKSFDPDELHFGCMCVCLGIAMRTSRHADA